VLLSPLPVAYPLLDDTPKNVHLLSLQPLDPEFSLFGLRLNHLWGKEEDSFYSMPVTINGKSLFSSYTIEEAEGTSLSWLRPSPEGIKGKEDRGKRREEGRGKIFTWTRRRRRRGVVGEGEGGVEAGRRARKFRTQQRSKGRGEGDQDPHSSSKGRKETKRGFRASRGVVEDREGLELTILSL
jgi:hypothetical protein